VGSAEVYARAANPQITPEGMFDSAIDKFVPVKFFDYVNQKMSDTKPSVTVQIPEGTPRRRGTDVRANRREGLGYQKTQNGGGTLRSPRR